MLHFALLGLAIYLVQPWWSDSSSLDTISVTPEIVQSLVKEREDLLGREIIEEEREQIVEDYIDKQILVAEAIKLGFDKADIRITNLLADRMKRVLAEEPRDPTEAQIDSFYRLESARYRSPDIISFEHIYYSSENLREEDYEKILLKLESGTIMSDQLGDSFWLGPSMEGYSRDALTTMLGAAFTDQIFELGPARWYGPIESARGIHLVRVIEKSTGQMLPLERARSLVIQDWLRIQREILLQQKIDEIRKAYTIEMVVNIPG